MLDRWAHLVDAAPEILVVGGASLDTLTVGPKTHRSAGGAGLYTALAARRAGAVVTMLAPRPEPMPDQLAPALRRIEWVGPIVPPERLPRFRIRYGDDGSVADFQSEVGAEPELRPGLLDELTHLPPMAFAVPVH